MALFETGDFKLHSGGSSSFKIDCDALTDEDWQTLAKIISDRFRFGKVVGIPTGGLKLAEALEPYISEGEKRILFVDDVLTTGGSMREMRAKWGGTGFGVVVFARGKCPYWIIPMFSMSAGFW